MCQVPSSAWNSVPTVYLGFLRVVRFWQGLTLRTAQTTVSFFLGFDRHASSTPAARMKKPARRRGCLPVPIQRMHQLLMNFQRVGKHYPRSLRRARAGGGDMNRPQAE